MIHRGSDQTTTRLLALFAASTGSNYISGQSLAKQSGISRSAIWKHIQQLRRYGYEIDSVRGLGYKLVGDTRAPVPWKLQERLKNSSVAREIIYMKSTLSTQLVAISIANRRPDASGVVVIAEEQSAGRGRLKRKWLSPLGGLWLSILIRPRIAVPEITVLPFVAGMAVRDAIEAETKLNARLKWPNDVLIAGKKVAGILLDVSAEADTTNFVVFGIGINANNDVDSMASKVPDSQGITSLRNELGFDVSRLSLTTLILEKIEYYLNLLNKKGKRVIVNAWKKQSDMIGRKVEISQNDKDVKKGIALDVDDDGALVVQMQSGGNVRLHYGDIRVRY